MKVILTQAEIAELQKLTVDVARESGDHNKASDIAQLKVSEYAELQGLKLNEQGDFEGGIESEKYVKIIKLCRTNVGAIVGIVKTLEGLYKTFRSLADGFKCQLKAIMAE